MSEFEDKLTGILNDPDTMNRIAGMAKSLMGSGAEAEDTAGAADAPFGGADMETIGRIAGIIKGAGAGDDNKTALFKAMEPYLSQKRREKMDRAMKIARLAKIAKLTIGEMGEEDV